ncbi:MAG TPA: hypothetical protein VMT71_05180 [Syntrophorhabdales bacterium]|nr:hypothetical protein [Syntrophorhabdales bacterium]
MGLDFNEKGYVIRVSESAAIQMCLHGLEAYTIYRKAGRRHKEAMTETFGLVWGHEVTQADGRTLYSVDLVSMDISAEFGKSFCRPYPEAFTLKKDIVTSFWPQYEFLGDFHTHPFKTIEDVVASKGFSLSKEDKTYVQEASDTWARHNYRACLVLTISRLKRRSDFVSLNGNVLTFTMGNYRLWLHAHVTQRENDSLIFSDTADIELYCPSFNGPDEYTKFGRLKKKTRLHYEPGEH